MTTSRHKHSGSTVVVACECGRALPPFRFDGPCYSYRLQPLLLLLLLPAELERPVRAPRQTWRERPVVVEGRTGENNIYVLV